MARPAKRQASDRPCAASLKQRSEHTTSYLTQAQLGAAPLLTAAELSKAKTRDISGEAAEELIADITGGTFEKARANRPDPDFRRDGLGFSLKTRAIEPVACRPYWTDWLGQEFTVQMSRLQPEGQLPAGKTLFDASPAAIGKRLVLAYNSMLEIYRWDAHAFLLRLREEEQQLTRYFYWEDKALPLDPSAYTWRNSDRQRKEGWTRNLRADEKGSRKRGKGGSEQRAALGWTSSGAVFTMRHAIPADADTWVVLDSQVLSRAEATQAMLEAINGRLA